MSTHGDLVAPSAEDTGRAYPAGAAATADPYKWTAIGLTALFTLTLPAILTLNVILQPAPPMPAWSAEAAALGVEPASISAGEQAFENSCTVCHGPSGDGVHGLGKPLRNSAYVQGHSDEELFDLIVEGRAPDDPLNTTGVLMPPRGAQNLSDAAIDDVVLYLRAIQDLSKDVVSTEPWDLASRESGGAGAAIELKDHPGYDLFVSSCAACHGQGAEGIEDQGLPLVSSGFIRGTSDEELISFIKRGRPMWDASNTTGLDMPPKGGNPAITDEQLQTIIDYIRALQDEAMGS